MEPPSSVQDAVPDQASASTSTSAPASESESAPAPAPAPAPTISMISIGTHSLWTSLSGPPQPTSPSNGDPDPLVVIVPGAGDVASSYVALERLLRPFTRVLLYDRTGLGRSERNPNPPQNRNANANVNSPSPRDDDDGTAVRAAAELHTLLTALSLAPPYILLAHSYGGIVAREFLHAHDAAVAGLLLVDCATERSAELLTFPDPNIVAVMGDLSFAKVSGLRRETVLSDDEWRARARDVRGSGEGAASEAASFGEVCATLRSRDQVRKCVLGSRPLVVMRANGVRDYRRVYEAGVAAGFGSAEEQEGFRELLGRWEGIDEEVQRGQMGLARPGEEGGVSRFVRVEDVGHFVHLVRPAVIAEQVRWVREVVLEQIGSARGIGLRL
ncbi:Alpha/Beta hydrolase protein [Aspergillus heterothallicus]